ncbi:MAG: hypothetical protein V1909_06000 [Candidatus Micrarchaeota archaeon]
MAISSEEKAVKLTTYLGKLPSRRRTLMVLVAMGFLFGLLSSLITPIPGGLSVDFFISLVTLGAKGVLLISIPAILSAFTVTAVKRKIGLQQSLFIAMTCALFYVLFYSLAMAGGGAGISPEIAFLGFGVAFVLW